MRVQGIDSALAIWIIERMTGFVRSTPTDWRSKMMEKSERTTWCGLSTQKIRRLSATSAVILAGLLAGCGGMEPTENDIALDGEEVSKLISGNTFNSAWQAERLMIVYFENGVVRGRHGLSGSDSGTWTVEEDVYCHDWVRYFGGTRRCYKWWKRPNDYLLQNVDSFGIQGLTGTISPGKPAGF